MMLRKKVVEAWAEQLSLKLGRSRDEIIEKGLTAYDFSPSRSVTIELSDGSVCRFNYAFFVLDKDTRRVAIFTEHCGYHEFSVRGAMVREIDEKIYVDDDYES